jgi:hypothetical protein
VELKTAIKKNDEKLLSDMVQKNEAAAVADDEACKPPAEDEAEALRVDLLRECEAALR